MFSQGRRLLNILGIGFKTPSTEKVNKTKAPPDKTDLITSDLPNLAVLTSLENLPSTSSIDKVDAWLSETLTTDNASLPDHASVPEFSEKLHTTSNVLKEPATHPGEPVVKKPKPHITSCSPKDSTTHQHNKIKGLGTSTVRRCLFSSEGSLNDSCDQGVPVHLDDNDNVLLGPKSSGSASVVSKSSDKVIPVHPDKNDMVLLASKPAGTASCVRDFPDESILVHSDKHDNMVGLNPAGTASPVLSSTTTPDVREVLTQETSVPTYDRQDFGKILPVVLPPALESDNRIQGEIIVLSLDDPVTTENCITINTEESSCHAQNKRKRSSPKSASTPPKKKVVIKADWKANKAKLARDSGEAHISLSGKQVPARVMGTGCKSTCTRSCHAHINEQKRLTIFNRYWSLKNLTRQWDFIARLVKIVEVKRRSVNVDDQDESPFRKHNYEYNLYDPDSSFPIKVCQTMFISTLGIGVRSVRTVLTRLLTNGGKISPDKRGKHTKRRTINPVTKAGVVAHINKFPRIESHYCRSDTRRKYLDENLSVAKMHRMYLIERGKLPFTATLRQYRDIFNTCFNLSFFKPKKDQCSRCLAWSYLSEEEKSDPVKAADHEQHKEDKEKIRTIRREDKELSRDKDASEKSGQVIRVSTFDLQKVLYCPKGENGEFFYKRKLSCYDFTVFDCTNKQGYCYCWDETVGMRGSDEINSFLLDYIETGALAGVTDFHFYSDSCTGQNKHKFLFSMYYLACIKFKIRIIHRWLEKGHTQMECDSVHARIERKTRHMEIFEPKEWWGHIMTAKVRKPGYIVTIANQDVIYSFRDLPVNFMWKKVPIQKLKEIRFDFAHPGIVKYKTAYTGNDTSFAILVKRPGRPINWSTHQPKSAYRKRLPLKPALYEDMQWYLQKGFIPAAHQDFYKSLPAPVASSNHNIEDEMEDSDTDNSENEDGDLPARDDGAALRIDPTDLDELADVPNMSNSDNAEDTSENEEDNYDEASNHESVEELDSNASDCFD